MLLASSPAQARPRLGWRMFLRVLRKRFKQLRPRRRRRVRRAIFHQRRRVVPRFVRRTRHVDLGSTALDTQSKRRRMHSAQLARLSQRRTALAHLQLRRSVIERARQQRQRLHRPRGTLRFQLRRIRQQLIGILRNR